MYFPLLKLTFYKGCSVILVEVEVNSFYKNQYEIEHFLRFSYSF